MDRKGSLSILDLILVLMERKVFVLVFMGIVSTAAIILTLVLPKSYSAKAVILPPATNQMSLPLGSLAGGDAVVSNLMRSLNLFGAGGGTDQLLSILDSRKLADRAIRKFDLETHYKFRGKKYFPEDVIRAFHLNLKVKENDFGNIEVSFMDKSPDRAYKMANFIVEQLDSINYQIAKEHAGYSRRFFEERLLRIKSDLDTAHNRFAKFKLANNYLDLEKQIESTVDVLAGIETERMSLELEIDQLRSKLGGDNQRLRELIREKGILEKRSKAFLTKGDGEILVALKSTPTLGIEYAYLFRDVKVQEAIYQFVLQMFEQAKMNEANNVPTVRVLEHAYLPKKRARPKRAIICILIFFSGLVVVSTIVVTQAWFARQRREDTETYRKLADLGAHLKFRK